MKIDVEQFCSYRKLVQNLVDRKGPIQAMSAATELAVTSGVAVFVIYYYVGEITGFDNKLLDRMIAVSKFYGYTEVLVDNPEIDLLQFTKRNVK